MVALLPSTRRCIDCGRALPDDAQGFICPDGCDRDAALRAIAAHITPPTPTPRPRKAQPRKRSTTPPRPVHREDPPRAPARLQQAADSTLWFIVDVLGDVRGTLKGVTGEQVDHYRVSAVRLMTGSVDGCTVAVLVTERAAARLPERVIMFWYSRALYIAGIVKTPPRVSSALLS